MYASDFLSSNIMTDVLIPMIIQPLVRLVFDEIVRVKEVLLVQLNPTQLTPMESFALFSKVVVPRPIVLVTTLNTDGAVNVAPYNPFVVDSGPPPTIAISVGERTAGVPKDTARNILARGEFVAHIVDDSFIPAIGVSATDFPSDISESEIVNLATMPSVMVETPTLSEAPVGLECTVVQRHRVGHSTLFLAEVVHIHVSPFFHRGDGFDLERLKTVGHLGLYDLFSEKEGRIRAGD